MIQHIITLTRHEREELLKRIYDGDTVGVYDELASKGTPVVIEMLKFTRILQSSIISIFCCRC